MNNELTEFNTGGTHSQNELGGIPQGMGDNGQMNTVEQGETKKDSFIYSNRITLTPQVISQFNLPKSLSGKTAADATKLINNKFEGRNSKLDNNTKKAFLDRIAEAQETIKAEEQAKIQEAMQINSTEVPDMMNGQVPQGMEEFTQPQQPMVYGGNLQNKMYGGGMMSGLLGGASSSMNQDPNQMNQGQAGGMGMGDFGGMFSGIDDALNTRAQQRDASKMPAGYIDIKGEQDQMNNKMIDSTKDSIAKATGPIGGLFRGIQKTGQGIGNSIGGEAGAAVSGVFSPEEGAMANLSDKDLSVGQKLLGTIPGVGGVIAKRQADKRMNEFKFKRDTLESNSKISNFAFGGELMGDPKTDPKLKVAPAVKTSITTESIPEDEIPGSHNSRLLGPIYEIQPGSDKNGQGNFIYYKPRTTLGFNSKTDREFISEKHMNDIYRSREYLAYMTNRQKQAALNRNPELTQPLPVNNNTTTFRMGGNMYAGGGPFDKSTASYDPTKINLGLPQQQSNQFLDNLNYVKNINNQGLTTLSPEQLQETNGYSNPELAPENVKPGYVSPYPKAKLGETLNKAGQYVKDNYGNALRYAPVAMNAYQLSKMGKPEVERLDRLGNKYNPQYMDEKALTNQINAETNYTANALSNASNGSLGSLSNNILGMQLNKTKALSDAYSKVADVNRNEDKTAQQFNLGVDQANIGQSNMEKDINARNRGAFKTERSKLLSQIGNDLGNIGKEQVYKKLAGKAFGYSYDGEYLLKPDGTKVSEEELDSTIKTNLSSVGATEKDGKYFDTTGKEISKEEVLKLIGTQKTFNKNYQGKFSSMNTDFGNISLTNNNKQ